MAAPGGFPWLTPAYGVVVAVQFVTFTPVAVSVGRRLPALRSVRFATAAALVAMAAIALLHLIPVAGARPVPGQTAGLLVVFGWIFTISGTGHRTGRLPRTATRLGLLIGASFLLAVVVLGPGLLLAPGSWTRVAFVGTGHVIEALGRLALPLWPLALARRRPVPARCATRPGPSAPWRAPPPRRPDALLARSLTSTRSASR